MPTEREVRESVAAQECLVQMIEECTKLFIPPLSQDFEVASVSSGDESEAPNLKETGVFDEGSYKTYLIKKTNELLKVRLVCCQVISFTLLAWCLRLLCDYFCLCILCLLF